jgi:hypothetical protein
MPKPTVFISYSHKDEAWKDRLVTHLKVLQEQGLVALWDDRRISAGDDWYEEIQSAIAAATQNIAPRVVIIVTANGNASAVLHRRANAAEVVFEKVNGLSCVEYIIVKLATIMAGKI